MNTIIAFTYDHLPQLFFAAVGGITFGLSWILCGKAFAHLRHAQKRVDTLRRNTDAYVAAKSAQSEAVRLIMLGVEIMSADQVAAWTGVREFLDDYSGGSGASGVSGAQLPEVAREWPPGAMIKPRSPGASTAVTGTESTLAFLREMPAPTIQYVEDSIEGIIPESAVITQSEAEARAIHHEAKHFTPEEREERAARFRDVTEGHLRPMTYEDMQRGAETLRKMSQALNADIPIPPVESTPPDEDGVFVDEWTDAQRAALLAETADEMGVPPFVPKGERPF